MVSITFVSIIIILSYWLRFVFFHRHQKILFPLLFTCFFIPKLNILSIPGLSSAGIRIDDLIVLVLLLISLFHPKLFRLKKIKYGIILLFILSLSNILSVAIGILSGYRNQLFYSIMVILRRIEYYSLICTGILLATKSHNNLKNLLREFNVLSLSFHFVAILQVIGKCTYAVSGTDAGFCFGGVAVSTFNGYYEYGQFLCFCCIVYLCVYLSSGKINNLLLFLFSLAMIILTKSRTSLIEAVILVILILIIPLKRRLSKPTVVTTISMILLCLCGVGYILLGASDLEKVGRFGTINLSEMVNNLINNLSSHNFTKYAEMIRNGISETEAMTTISDVSASMRFFKWGAAFDGFRKNVLFGYGIGITREMDGNYIKILAETGIIGFILWFALYNMYMKQCRKRKDVLICKITYYMMISILISSVFIDMFEASKPMEMLWLMIGVSITFDSSRARSVSIMREVGILTVK